MDKSRIYSVFHLEMLNYGPIYDITRDECSSRNYHDPELHF